MPPFPFSLSPSKMKCLLAHMPHIQQIRTGCRPWHDQALLIVASGAHPAWHHRVDPLETSRMNGCRQPNGRRWPVGTWCSGLQSTALSCQAREWPVHDKTYQHVSCPTACRIFPPLNSHSLTLPLHRNQQKRAQLSELCRSFSLPHSGNIKTLQDWLRDFSNDEDKWDR